MIATDPRDLRARQLPGTPTGRLAEAVTGHPVTFAAGVVTGLALVALGVALYAARTVAGVVDEVLG